MRLNKPLYFVLILVLPLMLLAGCSSAKKQLGFTKNTPDEFKVVKRAPLEMPPDYSLRPPRPGAARPQERETVVEAEAAVFGREAEKTYQPESGEEAFLSRAGASEIDNNIRSVVDEETAALRPVEEPVAKKLFGGIMGDDQAEAPASVLDAKAEAERLQKNYEEGRPLNEGDTPTVE